MKIGDKVISKKTGEYGIIIEVLEKNSQVYFKVIFENEDLLICKFKELYKI